MASVKPGVGKEQPVRKLLDQILERIEITEVRVIPTPLIKDDSCEFGFRNFEDTGYREIIVKGITNGGKN